MSKSICQVNHEFEKDFAAKCMALYGEDAKKEGFESVVDDKCKITDKQIKRKSLDDNPILNDILKKVREKNVKKPGISLSRTADFIFYTAVIAVITTVAVWIIPGDETLWKYISRQTPIIAAFFVISILTSVIMRLFSSRSIRLNNEACSKSVY